MGHCRFGFGRSLCFPNANKLKISEPILLYGLSTPLPNQTGAGYRAISLIGT
jgi:hypothetical protein